MKAYRLMAVDMDGTLLNSKKEISQENLAAISRARQAGFFFTLCTGRSVRSVQPYVQALGLTDPVILYNGAMIYHPVTGETLYHQTLEPADALEILRLGDACETTACIWSGSQLYANVLNHRILQYKKESGTEPILTEDLQLLPEKGITKVLWSDDVERIQKIQEELTGFPFSSVTFCTSSPEYLEFFNSRTSKGAALKRLGELYHIPTEEIIAVGDGFNDLSMITEAGLGVAMKNAPEGVKAMADTVTSRTNDQDGIAEILETFVL